MFCASIFISIEVIPNFWPILNIKYRQSLDWSKECVEVVFNKRFGRMKGLCFWKRKEVSKQPQYEKQWTIIVKF